MKKISIVLLLGAAMMWQPVIAQRNIKGNGNITVEERKTSGFSGINANSADDVSIYIKPGTYSVKVETDDNLQDKVSVKVKNRVLDFSYSGITPSRLRFYVTAPDINMIKASGASSVKTAGIIRTSKMKIDGSGAADIKVDIIAEELNIDGSGAADIKINGKTKLMHIDASGAADVKAGNCMADSIIAKASGAATVRVNPINYLKKNVSGAAEIKIRESTTSNSLEISNGDKSNQIVINSNVGIPYADADTTDIKIGSIEVTVIEGDTTKIKVGNHVLIVDDDGDVNIKRCKPSRFNGHWGGVELGINGYLTPDFDANFGKKYDYLTLRYEKSIAVNLNLWEQDFSLNRAKTIGFITGLGFSFNNYRFTQPTYLSPDSLNLSGFYMSGVSVRKTKLTSMYLSMPLIFEIQTNNPRQSKRLHFAVGAILNARLRTHTKIYFNEANKKYRLEDPETGIPSFNYYTTPNNNNRNIVKSFDSFSLQPFRVDATVRMGFGPINIFANYGLTRMFQKGRGPELNNWEVGISLAGW